MNNLEYANSEFRQENKFASTEWERSFDIHPFTNDVKSIPVTTSDGNDNRWKEIVVDDKVATIVNSTYPVMSFPDIMQKVKPALTEFMDSYGGEFTIHDRVYDGGLIQQRQIILKDTEVEHEIGDTTGSKIVMTNSYNGKTMFRLNLDTYRLQCLNGMSSLIPIVKLERKHCSRFADKEFVIDFPKVDKLIATQKDAQWNMNKMKSFTFTHGELERLLCARNSICWTAWTENNVIETRIHDIMHRAKLSQNIYNDNVLNGYSVFNALTHWASHTRTKYDEYGEVKECNGANEVGTVATRHKEVERFMNNIYFVYLDDKKHKFNI